MRQLLQSPHNPSAKLDLDISCKVSGVGSEFYRTLKRSHICFFCKISIYRTQTQEFHRTQTLVAVCRYLPVTWPGRPEPFVTLHILLNKPQSSPSFHFIFSFLIHLILHYWGTIPRYNLLRDLGLPLHFPFFPFDSPLLGGEIP